MRPMSPLSSMLVLALALAGCASVPQTAPRAPVATIPSATAHAGAHDNLNAVLWVQRSAEYRAAAETVYRAAERGLDRALADPDWDALAPDDRIAAVRDLPPAVVMDVDETVLDNSPYQARLVVDGDEYADASWDAWVAEQAAAPVPGVVRFAGAAASRGITVIYLSNRGAHLQEATLANLRAHGLPVKDASVFLGLGTTVGGCQDAGSDKSCRRRHVARNYRVLMQFGDQLGDFVTPPAKTTAAAASTVDAHAAWFGERWWMLPNPTYGGWEPALFDNDWSRDRPTRRASKRAALQPLR